MMTMKIILEPDLMVEAKRMDTEQVARAAFDAEMDIKRLRKFFENSGYRVTDEQWEEIEHWLKKLERKEKGFKFKNSIKE